NSYNIKMTFYPYFFFQQFNKERNSDNCHHWNEQKIRPMDKMSYHSTNSWTDTFSHSYYGANKTKRFPPIFLWNIPRNYNPHECWKCSCTSSLNKSSQNKYGKKRMSNKPNYRSEAIYYNPK